MARPAEGFPVLVAILPIVYGEGRSARKSHHTHSVQGRGAVSELFARKKLWLDKGDSKNASVPWSCLFLCLAAKCARNRRQEMARLLFSVSYLSRDARDHSVPILSRLAAQH